MRLKGVFIFIVLIIPQPNSNACFSVLCDVLDLLPALGYFSMSLFLPCHITTGLILKIMYSKVTFRKRLTVLLLNRALHFNHKTVRGQESFVIAGTMMLLLLLLLCGPGSEIIQAGAEVLKDVFRESRKSDLSQSFDIL